MTANKIHFLLWFCSKKMEANIKYQLILEHLNEAASNITQQYNIGSDRWKVRIRSKFSSVDNTVCSLTIIAQSIIWDNIWMSKWPVERKEYNMFELSVTHISYIRKSSAIPAANVSTEANYYVTRTNTETSPKMTNSLYAQPAVFLPSHGGYHVPRREREYPS